jgi:hypothetical protein
MGQIKILFAADANDNSRFLTQKVVKELSQVSWIDLHVVGYHQFLPPDIHYDFNLQSNMDLFNRRTRVIKNNCISYEFELYSEYIKGLKPDLILSDFENLTVDRALANDFEIILLTNKMVNQNIVPVERRKLHIQKEMQNRLVRFFDKFYDYMGLLENGLISHALIYTQFVDMYRFRQDPNITYIRPYHKVVPGKNDKIVFAYKDLNPYIDLVSRFRNNILYTDTKIMIKSMDVYPLHHPSFYESLCGCKFLVTDGMEMALSDAYYSGKYSIITNKFDDWHARKFDAWKYQAARASEVKYVGKHVQNYESLNLRDVELMKVEPEKGGAGSLTQFLENKYKSYLV